MTIRFSCDCGKVLQAQEEHAGKRTKCPGCGAMLTIPDGSEAAPTPKGPPPSPVQERTPSRRRPAQDEDEYERDERDEPDDEPERRRPKGPATASSGKALAALLLGIGSFCGWFLTGIPALILGFLSIRDINRSGGKLTGKGMAIAGLILAGLSTFLVCPAGTAAIWWITSKTRQAVGEFGNKVEEAANRAASSNNLRQLGLGMHSYNDQYRSLPAAGMPSPKTPPNQTGTPLLSWRVYMLPYIGEDGLYRQFRLDEPWDSPNNKPLIARMPKVFETPGRPMPQPGMTYYQVVTSPHKPGMPWDAGKSALFGGPSRPKMPASFPDGTSNTILVVEAADPVIWTKPEDVIFTPGGPTPTFGDPTKDSFLVCLADGSVRSLSRKNVSDQTLRNAITPADGQPLGFDW